MIVLCQPGGQLGARVQFQLAVDPLEVRFGGARADHQRLRDLAVGEARRHQRRDFPLAETQYSHSSARPTTAGPRGSGSSSARAKATACCADIARPRAQAAENAGSPNWPRMTATSRS